MDKKKILMLITLFLCFFSFCKSVKALTVCDFENNYGSFNTVVSHNIKTCGIKRDKGCDMYGLNAAAILNYNMTSRGSDNILWSDDEVSFAYAFAADYGKDGDYVKSAIATLYDDDGKAQCYLEFDTKELEKEKYELVAWQFKFNKKHVSYIEFSGTYFSNTSDEVETYNGSNGIEKVDIRKKTDGSGVDHTGDGSNTTTTVEKVGKEATGVAGTVTAKESKEDVIKTNENGEIIMGGTSSCTDVKNIIHDYWKYVMIVVPVLLIIMIVLDFFKALGSNDADAIKKASTNAFKRTIAAIILLALPSLLGLVLGWFGIPLCI